MTPIALLLLSPAHAADEVGFDAHGFTLHAFDGDIRDPLTVDRPGPWEGGDFWLAGIMEYADRPLVRVTAPTTGNDEPLREVVLDQVVALNANAGVAFHRYARMDVTMPVYFTSIGPKGYQDPTIGDLRVSAMVPVLRPVHVVGGGGPGVGVSGHADVPIGNSDAFLGQPGVAGGFTVSGTYEGPWYTFAAELGGQFNPSIDLENLTNSDQFVAGAAVNVLPGPRTGITAETHLYAPFQASSVAGTGMPAEVLLSLRQQFGNGVSFLLGGAAGISEGASAARYRAFLGFGFGVVAPPRQPDTDLVAEINVRDRCPGELEVENGWKDDDGCPDQLGQLSFRAVFAGQDVDEGDMVVAGPEGSVTVPNRDRMSVTAKPGTKYAVRSSVPSRCLYGEADGAAGETSGELVVELHTRLDAQAEVFVVDPAGVPIEGATVRWTGGPETCLPPGPPANFGAVNRWVTPMGVGTRHLVVDAPGFRPHEQDVDVPPTGSRTVVVLEPAKVVLERTRIVILDKVFFAFNKSTILPESFQLLDDVAAVIAAHPEVGRVQVEGHTDDKGNDAYNLKLSQSRADAVKVYLVNRGIPAERLVAAGFGETRPIETNQTEEGRSINRRVEFNLIDQVEPVPGEATPAPGGAP